MSFTKIRKTTALALLVLLLTGTPWIGMFVKRTGYWDTQEWIHAFCLTQTVLLAACAVYGPGKFISRIPFVVAWGLAIGFALARLNMFSLQGRASLAAGAILVATGTLSPLIVFALHRRSTGATLTFGMLSQHHVGGPAFQVSLRVLMLLTAAFAVVGIAARSAITAPPDAFGNTQDQLVLHAWLGFFLCLTAAPAWLAVFRPVWRILLVCFCCVFVALVDPILLGLAAPFIFVDNSSIGITTTWDYFLETSIIELVTYGKVLFAVVIYALLARAGGFRMLVPGQSKDKNPNPSAQPATEAGCVQD